MISHRSLLCSSTVHPATGKKKKTERGRERSRIRMAPVVVSATRPPAAVGGDGDPPPMKPPTAVGDPDPAAPPPPPPAAPGFSIELTIRAVVCPLSPSSESKSPSVAPLDNNGSRHGPVDSGTRSSVDPTPTNDPTPDPGNPSPSPCRVALQGDRSKL
ncbi:classical arabinogalactan protein 4-like isoform X2 [Oryza glaberrima]|uniref:classical arabinogalactan protein 4-like isoform X2 n=1 Tax=Oryza glaberrima TaxID=4538 RepID=UPI00224C31FE|nr:classical arabinogalactan protein 4-like isoform X2 [Oryza glaberrima]